MISWLTRRCWFPPASWPAPYGNSFFVGLHGWVGGWTNAGVQWAPVDATSHRPTRPTEFFVRGFGRRTAPHGVKVYSPAFDVTPARLITAIVCERGILRRPFGAALRRACARKA